MEYLTNEIWKEYYEVTSPEKRLKLYETLSSENPDDGGNALRKKLFENRHLDKKKKVKEIDRGLWQLLSMQVNIKSEISSLKVAKKEIDAALRCLGVDDAKKGGEVEKGVVYWEIRNIAKRYLETCQAPGYARKLFGIMDSSEEEKIDKTVNDIFMLARMIPERYRLEDDMKIFTDALEAELGLFSEEAAKLYEERLKAFHETT